MLNYQDEEQTEEEFLWIRGNENAENQTINCWQYNYYIIFIF
jgi:hypothetical protein